MISKVFLIYLSISLAFAGQLQNEFIQKIERPIVLQAEDLQDYSDLPEEFSWANKSGISYITKSQNQHIPQYCGSCWAWGATSALSDRIKIARGAKGSDIFLSVQYILNCHSNAGSCHGGDDAAVYDQLKNIAWPYDTSNPYIACSSDSKEGFCEHVDTKCHDLNVARTCMHFGQNCTGLSQYPNATVNEWGYVQGHKKMMREIYERGTISCGVNASPIDDYTGGIVDMPDASKGINHIISIIGWGKDEKSGRKYWIIRNSWGEYWGELGFFRAYMGDNQLGLENSCSWATIGSYTEMNYPCSVDGSNCIGNNQQLYE